MFVPERTNPTSDRSHDNRDLRLIERMFLLDLGNAKVNLGGSFTTGFLNRRLFSFDGFSGLFFHAFNIFRQLLLLPSFDEGDASLNLLGLDEVG